MEFAVVAVVEYQTWPEERQSSPVVVVFAFVGVAIAFERPFVVVVASSVSLGSLAFVEGEVVVGLARVVMPHSFQECR